MLITLFQTAAVDFSSGTLPGSSEDVGSLISQLLAAIFIIAALLTFLYLIWGGISWITAGGDSSKVGKARDRITQAVVGLIVLAATTAIFALVQGFLGINILKFNTKDPSRLTPEPPVYGKLPPADTRR